MARSWTADEDALIRKMLDAGWTPWGVAGRLHRRMKRSRRAVDTRARRIRDGKLR